MSKSRDLAKKLEELHKLGAVEVSTAQEAVQLKKYAETYGKMVGLIGTPGKWKIYDMTAPMGSVI